MTMILSFRSRSSRDILRSFDWFCNGVGLARAVRTSAAGVCSIGGEMTIAFQRWDMHVGLRGYSSTTACYAKQRRVEKVSLRADPSYEPLKPGSDEAKFLQVKEAVICYKKSLGLGANATFVVPLGYVVPSHTEFFPKSLWGLPLDAMIQKIIRKRAYQELLRAEGLKVSGTKHDITEILEALRCYRALHPTKNRILQTFVVPRDSPDFPQHLWGMKLGNILQNMTTANNFKQFHSEVEAIGFKLSMSYRDMLFEEVLDALRCFRKLHPTRTRVPPSYVVPQDSPHYPPHVWGMKLGKRFFSLIQGQHKRHHAKVEALGLILSTGMREERFNDILTALKCYRKLYPTKTRIPLHYQVPEDSPDYPSHVWGMKLGNTLMSMISDDTYIEHFKEVEALGFAMTRGKYLEDRSKDILTALQCYRKLYPTKTKVTATFQVPEGSSDFPAHVWGMKLGEIVSTMIYRSTFHEIHREVEEMGFTMASGYLDDRSSDILAALRCYRTLHPTKNRVPQTYEVPEGSADFPEHLWGMKLGSIVNTMIHQGTLSEYRSEIEKMGFLLTANVHEDRFKDILDALRCYRTLHPKKSRVAPSYVVPEGSSDYPSHLWGLKLGRTLKSMIVQGTYDKHLGEVEALGFKMKKGVHEDRFKDILDALQCYRTLHPTETIVPYSYVVPEGSSDYPSRAWGMKLGRIMNNMIQVGRYSALHGDVQRMGYVLSKIRGKRRSAVPGRASGQEVASSQ